MLDERRNSANEYAVMNSDGELVFYTDVLVEAEMQSDHLRSMFDGHNFPIYVRRVGDWHMLGSDESIRYMPNKDTLVEVTQPGPNEINMSISIRVPPKNEPIDRVFSKAEKGDMER